jgi:ATP-binding cassette subfamily B protein
MNGLKTWFRSVTFGQPQKYIHIAAWMFFDGMVASVPFAVMLVATFMLLGPAIDPLATLSLAQGFILCGLLLAETIIYYFVARRTYKINTVSFADVIREARVGMGEQLRRLPMGFHSRRDAGDLSTVLLRDYEVVETNSSTIMPLVTTIAARMLLTVVIFGFIDWRMMFAVIAVIPFCVPFAILSYRKLGGKSKALLQTQQENTSRILEYVGGIQTLKAFNRGDEMFTALKASCDDLRRKSMSMESAAAPLGMIARFILNCGTGVVMGIGAALMFGGALSPLWYIAFLLVALNIYSPLLTLFFLITNMSAMNICAARVQSVMEENRLPVMPGKLEAKNADIVFSHVSFGYNDSNVLRDVSLMIPQKSLTALVGPSGSGKSTITRLIARFWDARSGVITFGGVPITQMEPDELLSKISVVFQDVYLFHDTVENNIRMGKPGATHDEIVGAAKRAACHDFIVALPNGYDTMVGEGGSTLSGGEKQRVSIARALLKDAPVVLLDEATASLDPENEVLIQQAIGELVRDKTVVIIAHRLRSIQNASQIVVMENGRIVDVGSHEALIAQNGSLYARMWREQQKAGAWSLV